MSYWIAMKENHQGQVKQTKLPNLRYFNYLVENRRKSQSEISKES